MNSSRKPRSNGSQHSRNMQIMSEAVMGLRVGHDFGAEAFLINHIDSTINGPAAKALVHARYWTLLGRNEVFPLFRLKFFFQ
jgi:hypothetical protein